MKICYVSLFFDLDRGNWNSFKRSFDTYLMRFYPFIEMFKVLNLDYEMVLYMDKKHCDVLERLITRGKTRIRLIPIDEAFIEEHFPLWKRLGKETEIMNSFYYKSLTSHRTKYPENTNPKYTMINHCKIDAIVHTIQHVLESDYYLWIDFGYFDNPEFVTTNYIKLDKLDKTRINYSVRNKLTEKDVNLIRTIRIAPERMIGSFFFGSKDNMIKYQKIYYQVHQFFHDIGIVDDDQHVSMIACIKHPELFVLHHSPEWKSSLKYLST